MIFTGRIDLTSFISTCTRNNCIAFLCQCPAYSVIPMDYQPSRSKGTSQSAKSILHYIIEQYAHAFLWSVLLRMMGDRYDLLSVRLSPLVLYLSSQCEIKTTQPVRSSPSPSKSRTTAPGQIVLSRQVRQQLPFTRWCTSTRQCPWCKIDRG